MTEMYEKIISTERIFEGHIVKLVVHQVELPNGKHSQREIVNHNGAVAIIALDDDDNLLMIRQFRLAAEQVLLEIPAGTLEIGEDPDECAIRELREETGYRPGKIERVGGWFMAPGYTTEYIHLYIATDLVHDPISADDDEFIELERVSFDEALARLDRGEIINSTAVAGLLRSARHLNRS